MAYMIWVTGACNLKCKDKKIQVNTLEIIQTVLHPTFQLAVRDNIIRNNPSDGVMAQIKKLPGRNHGIRHALTLEQQRAFIRYVEENEKFESWVTLFKFLLGTGCRIGEAVGIRWEDIDFKKRIISINHSLVYYSSITFYGGFFDWYDCYLSTSIRA